MLCKVPYCAMQMDRKWMYNADRHSKEFIDGLHYFLDVAEANKHNGFMCPVHLLPGQEGLLIFKDPSQPYFC
jgi:hypothetical protein